MIDDPSRLDPATLDRLIRRGRTARSLAVRRMLGQALARLAAPAAHRDRRPTPAPCRAPSPAR